MRGVLVLPFRLPFPPDPPPVHSLGRELADQLERGEAGVGEAVFVAAHLEGAQPVADRAEGGVMGQPLV